MKRLFPAELCLAAVLAAASSVSAATLTVNAGGDLQAAIDAAHPGDTIVLQAGATFNGPFKLRVKNGTTPITIRWSYNSLAHRDSSNGNPPIDCRTRLVVVAKAVTGLPFTIAFAWMRIS